MPSPSKRLPPNQQLILTDRWPLVGERLPRDDDSPWQVSVSGLVGRNLNWTLEELRDVSRDELVTDIHCVTRWSKYDMHFRGVAFERIVSLASPTPEAKYVSFIARSDRHHSTSLTLDDLSNLKPLIAFEANGSPLAGEHGGPVRMVVPGRYFYKSVKWLERIEFLAEDQLGYWEEQTGYHNHADPWKEERYLAPTLDKRTAARLIAARDFRGHDLRSIDASDRQLDGLQAQRALLRNANFQGAALRGANFSEANLSNANLIGADLRDSRFQGTDLEGADLSGANLSGADLSGASLFGTSFTQHDSTSNSTINPAIFDDKTIVNHESLEALTDGQLQFVRQHLAP